MRVCGVDMGVRINMMMLGPLGAGGRHRWEAHMLNFVEHGGKALEVAGGQRTC